MLEAKIIEIDKMQFQLNPLKGFTALKLDKKVIGLVLPIIEGVKDLDTDFDMSKIVSGLTRSLDNMKDDDYEKFILNLLSTVVIILPGQPPQEIDTKIIDDEFRGKATTLYKLIFEVMKFNKFTPFALVNVAGKGTMKTLISGALTKVTGS